ncbi:hypothetical protein [Sulfuricurvum sp.]|uniref:hypothetical protein n=1 Tax=Sulfuricurvum sp. TaxID=2025608 RepID=UPI0026297CF9|nr:hypothetical protein [Sulfuricurvum sp.]MDD3597195.1 hypothetical protein [Sulfuricurvum sp.]
MDNLAIIFGTGVYFLNEWILSYNNKLKFYESTLSLVAIGISVVFFVMFLQIILLAFVQRTGFHFILALVLSVLLIFQLAQNIKTFIRSKRHERILVNTINHLIHTKQVKEVSISELIAQTSTEDYHEAKRIATIAKHNGHVPYTLILAA